jgi:hypothetical protein
MSRHDHVVTAHQLAQLLLAEPDRPVYYADDYTGKAKSTLSVYSDEECVYIDIGTNDEEEED